MSQLFWFRVIVSVRESPYRKRDETGKREITIPFPDMPEFRAIAEQYGYHSYDLAQTRNRKFIEAKFRERELHKPEVIARHVAWLREHIVDRRPPCYRWYSLNELLPAIPLT